MADPKPDKNKEILRYAGMGFEILATMILCVGAGYYLDQKVGTEKPWFTLGFSLLGCGVALYLMIRSLDKTKKS